MKRLLIALAILLCSPSAFAAGGGHWSSWARRPWFPRDMGSNLRNDWDAGNATTSAGKVVTVPDTASGFTLTDGGNAPQRPTWSAIGPNGHAAITHDGIAQVLESAVGGFNLSPPFTYVLVFKQYATPGQGTFLSDSGATAFQMNATTPRMSLFGGTANNVVAGTIPNADPIYGVMMIEKNGASTNWYNNGVALTDDNVNPGTGAIDMLVVGGFQYFPFSASFLHCTWTRIMIVPAILSTVDRARLTFYLRAKYAI